ncbi:sigma-54 interaction domain-containing protein [Zavarzinia sp.]|uniref:sigma-54 interaction domain-containing protein n=1 Tax=Zavarzinia sp. TaxID=2027920 RepID=UPI003568EA57
MPENNVIAISPGAAAHAPPIFVDPASVRLEAEIDRVARATVHILLLGETGVGKELVARQIHERSTRRSRPFVAVNCAALSESLFESELFGHERGAFTGAVTATAGWFEAADGGTLFLDEIGELAPAMQAKLLRVIQEREVTRVGARVAKPINVRLVTATNVDLEQAIAVGRFREDLYYRIKVAALRIPPLRERPGDILPLARHFAALYASSPGPVHFSAEAEAALLRHGWPGNIRELENVIQAALVGLRTSLVTALDLRLSQRRGAAAPTDGRMDRLGGLLDELLGFDAPDLFGRVQHLLVARALAASHGNQMQAAASLGITRNVLRTLMQRYGLIGPPRRNS